MSGLTHNAWFHELNKYDISGSSFRTWFHYDAGALCDRHLLAGISADCRLTGRDDSPGLAEYLYLFDRFFTGTTQRWRTVGPLWSAAGVGHRLVCFLCGELFSVSG